MTTEGFEGLDEIRKAAAEDIAAAGQALLVIREMIDYEELEKLMPAWKVKRFRQCLTAAATGAIKAMDCLMPQDSPTTQILLDTVIQRWETAPKTEKEEIVARLRKAFTQEAKP